MSERDRQERHERRKKLHGDDLFRELIEVVEEFSANLGKYAALQVAATNSQNESIKEGFALVAEAITNNQPVPPTGPSMQGVQIMYNVSVDETPKRFTIDLTGAEFKDAKGNVIANEDARVELVSDNPSVTIVNDPDDGTLVKTGTISFGPTTGLANVTGPVTDISSGAQLGVLGNQFNVFAGEAASMSGGTFAVEGLTQS
jgi:hypothetical protein